MKKEVKDGITVAVFVIIAIVLVYFTIAIFKTEELGSKKTTTSTTQSGEVTNIFSDMILASSTFNKSQDEYMVVFFHNKEISETLKTKLNNYSSDIKLYKVNLDEAINSFVISEEENPKATKASELKINKTTLITIKQNSITSYVTDEDEILQLIN